MRPTEKIEKLVRKFEIDINTRKDRKTLDELLQAQGKTQKLFSADIQPNVWRAIMKNRIIKLAAAAVIAATILGVIDFWPSSSGNGKWWLGPSAVWGQEILKSLDSVKAIVRRQRAFNVRDYGSDTMNIMWDRSYAAMDKYRKDTFGDANKVYSTEWVLPNGEGFVKYEIWPEHQCFTQKPEKTPPFYDNVMGSLHRYVSFLDKASRMLGTETFEGRECVGFEISMGKYGDFWVNLPTRVWFDIKTKLPARVERRGLKTDYDPSMTLTLIEDQFDYYAEVPADMFTLQIPEGFVNASPDEIAAKKEKMVFADVPENLRDEIVAAIKETQTVVYQQHLEVTVNEKSTVYPTTKTYLSRNNWREDKYGGKQLNEPQKIEWYNIEKEDQQKTEINFSEESVYYRLIQITVDFDKKSYSSAVYNGDDYKEVYSQPRHPMERILFLASLVNKADRILENTEIDGIKCFGVEISANKYGNNSPNDKHRLWFSIETKLPVRMEFEYWQKDGKTKSVKICDQFQWNPELPRETFVPEIPEGFQLEASNK